MNGQVNFLWFQKHAETNRARIVTQTPPMLKLAGDFSGIADPGAGQVNFR